MGTILFEEQDSLRHYRDEMINLHEKSSLKIAQTCPKQLYACSGMSTYLDACSVESLPCAPDLAWNMFLTLNEPGLLRNRMGQVEASKKDHLSCENRTAVFKKRTYGKAPVQTIGTMKTVSS